MNPQPKSNFVVLLFYMENYQFAKSIVRHLVDSGFIAYFAGGWVRDFLMGHPSEDIDIATNASPQEIMNLFPNTLLVGLSFGVVIVVVQGHSFEVATFRKDLKYIDGRHPTGIELSSPREDALRRDFTINGMFYDPLDETIHDFVQGQEDIKRGIIRTIGDPNERFFEDRLRMLRAFRFSARFGFSIEQETKEAIRNNADKLFPAVAWERVWQEFNKMAAYPRFSQAILDMHDLLILSVIFPELEKIHLHDLRHRVSTYSHLPKNCPTIVYLMELFEGLNLAKKIDIAKRTKATNKDIKLIEYIDTLFRAIPQIESKEMQDLQTWTHLMAHPDSSLGLHIFAARMGDHDRERFFDKISSINQKLSSPIRRVKERNPVVSSQFLIKKGFKPGIHLGHLLKEAEKIAIQDGLEDAESVIEKLSQLSLWGHHS